MAMTPDDRQFSHGVLDLVAPAMIAETGGQAVGQVQTAVHFPHQQATPVGRNVSAIELGHYLAPIQGVNSKVNWVHSVIVKTVASGALTIVWKLSYARVNGLSLKCFVRNPG